MSPRSNVKIDSLAVFAATVMDSILEGKLGEIAFFTRSVNGGGGRLAANGATFCG
jgi:hypothetical protein